MTDFREATKQAALGRIVKGVLRAFLEAIGTALNRLKLTVEVWYDKMKYDLAVTPQVWSLERMLNDEFDPVSRRIVIEEPEVHEGWFFFRATDPEYKKFYLNGRAYFSGDTRYSGSAGFVVVLPMSINATDRMRALIERYKLVSINYTIINR